MDKSWVQYMDEKFEVSHLTCPIHKIDLVKHMTSTEVPVDGGKKQMGLEVSSCPKCGFIGDVEPI